MYGHAFKTSMAMSGRCSIWTLATSSRIDMNASQQIAKQIADSPASLKLIAQKSNFL
jgi:hypothetical protein